MTSLKIDEDGHGTLGFVLNNKYTDMLLKLAQYSQKTPHDIICDAILTIYNHHLGESTSDK